VLRNALQAKKMSGFYVPYLPFRWNGGMTWRDSEEKFTFAVCAVALVIVLMKVWFE